MKHLHNFDTVAEYEAGKDTLEMPYIVSIDETDGLQYNTDVIRVPQGSGGSGGESEGSNVEYLDVSGFNVENDDELFLKESLIGLSVAVKIPKSFSVIVDLPIGTGTRINTVERGIYPGATLALEIGQYTWDNYKEAKKQTVNGVSVVAVDFSQLMTLDGNLMDIQEIIALSGLTEIIDSLPHLTKEQFYTLE